MSVYPDVEEIKGWIQWTRASLPGQGDIPYLNWEGPTVKTEQSNGVSPEAEDAGHEEPPWMGELLEVLDESALVGGSHELHAVLDAFAQAMLADLRDLAPRFTALHFYYSLATEEYPKYSMYNEDISTAAQDAFQNDLKILVGMLPVDECPHEWPRIKWEISNALAVKDWDRAHQLFKLAEVLNATEHKHLCALRAQFNFFVAFGKFQKEGGDTDYSILSVNPAGGDPGSYFFLRAYRTALAEAPEKILHGKLDKKAQEMLREARNDLESAIQDRADLCPAYHAMLGTCYLALGFYAQAAQEYGRVLASGTALKGIDFVDMLLHVLKGLRREPGEDLPGLLKRAVAAGDPSRFSIDFKPDLLRVLAKSYVLADQPAKAEDVYVQWRQEYPDDPRVYRHLAELFARETKYKEAYEALRREVELRPELEEDVATTIALALGGAPISPEKLATLAEELMRKLPQVTELINSLNVELWPAYKRLGDPARGKWLQACCLMYYMTQLEPAQKEASSQSAAMNFALAVELEMRSRVFGQFKAEVSKDRLKKLANQSRSENGKESATKPFCDYLLSHSKISLGSMHWVLDDCRKSQAPILHEFRDWLNKRHGALLEEKVISVLKAVVDLRNPTVHSIVTPEEASRAPALCRSILERLYEAPS